MSDQAAKQKPVKKKRWKWLKRCFLASVLMLLLVVLLGWLFLPRIAERMIRGMIANAGLDGTELTVKDVGWRSAVIEGVKLRGDAWSVQAERINLSYDPNDLAAGRMEEIVIHGLVAEFDLQPEQASGDAASPESDTGEKTNPFSWLHELPGNAEKVGRVIADDARVILKRGQREVVQSVDLGFEHSAFGRLAAEVVAEDYRLDLSLAHSGDSTKVTVLGFDIQPEPFMGLIEFLSDVDEPFMPEGFEVSGAELTGKLEVVGDELQPIQVTGTLSKVMYDGGEKPVNLKTDPVTMRLEIHGGGGFVRFAGSVDEVVMPLDPSTGFELTLAEGEARGPRPKWSVDIAWGDEPTLITGKINKLNLFGSFEDQPIDLSELQLDFRMAEQKLMVGGGFTHGGTQIPLRYTHNMKNLSEDKWMLDGEVVVGTIMHSEPLPALNAVSDIFADVVLAGKSKSQLTFSVGSHDAFRGVMTTKLSDAQVNVAEGKLKASGVNGTWALHLLPPSLPSGANGETEDPSYYTVDFSVEKLELDSKDALDYDLVHEAENPVRISGKGKFGDEGTSLDGTIKNLTLYGEKDGNELILADTQAAFSLNGDVLSASGSTSLGENTIPFSYRHELSSTEEGWKMSGFFKIADAKLTEPVENAVMFVEAMEGKTLSGRVAMKMDFTLGSDEDFDGVLAAALTGGRLEFEDDGPVLEGLRGDIRLSSLKEKKTDGYHRVQATKVKAFDMEMSNLRLDYKMLPNGNVPLKNIAINALGGQVWVDPFVLPEGDANYQFKLRMKRLDLAQLAKLFPDFNGNISGRIDGLLPMQSINGDFRPVRGGMYLTPRSRARLRYDAGNKFSAGIDPKTQEYKKMKMVEDSLRNLELRVLSIRMFDPQDGDKAIVLKLRGQAPSVPGSPPIHLNINGFKPDDDTLDFFDLLLKHRDKLNFGL